MRLNAHGNWMMINGVLVLNIQNIVGVKTMIVGQGTDGNAWLIIADS